MLTISLALSWFSHNAVADDELKINRAYYVGVNDKADAFLIALQFDAGGLLPLDKYAYTQFYVTVNGNSRIVTSAVGGDTTVILTVSGQVSAKENVQVTYYPYEQFQLADKGGRKIKAFQQYSISMGSDWTRPEVDTVLAKGRSIVLTFTKDLDMTQKYETYQFTIKANQIPQMVKAIYVTQRAVMLYLEKPIEDAAEVTVSYTGGQPPLSDTSGNSVDLFNDKLATNQSQSATLLKATAAGNKLTLTFDKPVISYIPPIRTFEIKKNGNYTNVTDALIVGQSVILTLQETVQATDILTATYRNTSYGALETNDGMAVKSFTDYQS